MVPVGKVTLCLSTLFNHAIRVLFEVGFSNPTHCRIDKKGVLRFIPIRFSINDVGFVDNSLSTSPFRGLTLSDRMDLRSKVSARCKQVSPR
eukprot:scaffold3079_cov174-Amphora_coffeaeformis.AAC.27